VHVKVGEPGDHVFRIGCRSEGFKIDRVVLRHETESYVPTGIGPAESLELPSTATAAMRPVRVVQASTPAGTVHGPVFLNGRCPGACETMRPRTCALPPWRKE